MEPQTICTTEQTYSQHQADSMALGAGSQGDPSTWALAHPGACWLQRPQEAPMAQGDFPVTRIRVSSCYPRTTVAPAIQGGFRGTRLPVDSHQSRPLTHPSICWLWQPQVTSKKTSSQPTQAAPVTDVSPWTLPNLGSQITPELANSCGTRLLVGS